MDSLYQLLLLAGFAFFAMALSCVFSLRVEWCFSLGFFVIILVLYGFAMFERLRAGVWACVGLLGASALCFPLLWRKRKDKLRAFALQPGLVLFALVFLFLLYLHRNRMLASWDEFSHWGLVVKNMYVFDAFGNVPEATTYFTRYPPAISLFQYFWARCMPGFNEANLFRALHLFTLSLLLPMAQGLSWKQWKRVIPAGLLALAVPSAFQTGFYGSIYMDAALGVFFANVMAFYFLNRKRTDGAAGTVYICLALFAFCLAKDAALGLCGIFLLCAGIDRAAQWAADRKENSGKAGRKALAFFACCAATVWAARGSWEYEVNRYWGAVAAENAPTVVRALRDAFFLGGNYREGVARSFVDAFFQGPMSNGIFGFSYFVWILLITLGFLALSSQSGTREERIGRRTAALSIPLSAALYGVALLVTYLVRFSSYEAARLASMGRYLKTMLVGVSALAALILANQTAGRDGPARSGRNPYLAWLCLLVLTNPYPLVNAALFVPSDTAGIREMRGKTDGSLAYQSVFQPGDRVYVIAQNTDGFEYWQQRYNFTPVPVNEGGWSLGSPSDEDDRSTKPMTLGEWESLLEKEYTYVYIQNVTESFVAEFGEAFAEPGQVAPNGLYRVDTEGDGVVLRLVEPGARAGDRRGVNG